MGPGVRAGIKVRPKRTPDDSTVATEGDRIDKPGLGVAIDEDKVARYHAEYRKHGRFPTYVGKAHVAGARTRGPWPHR